MLRTNWGTRYPVPPAPTHMYITPTMLLMTFMLFTAKAREGAAGLDN